MATSKHRKPPPRRRHLTRTLAVSVAVAATLGTSASFAAAPQTPSTVAVADDVPWQMDPVIAVAVAAPAAARAPSYLMAGLVTATATPAPEKPEAASVGELDARVGETDPSGIVQAPAPPSLFAATAGSPDAGDLPDGAAVTGSPYRNGFLPADVLCTVPFAPNQRLGCDAAAALDELNEAWRTDFGRDIAMTDSYRSFAAQVACKIAKPVLCATPGTSNHGWGVAVDFAGGIQTQGTAQHAWMEANAARFGWVNPSWAQPTGAKPEPWHWEFVGR